MEIKKSNLERWLNCPSSVTIDIKCQCGAEGRYQNMANGEFVWTCGKRGCLNQKPVTTSAHTE